MIAALAGEEVLAADETPVNVLDKTPSAGVRRNEADPGDEEEAAAGAPHVRTRTGG